MTWFEGRDHSTNWATTTAQNLQFFDSIIFVFVRFLNDFWANHSPMLSSHSNAEKRLEKAERTKFEFKF